MPPNDNRTDLARRSPSFSFALRDGIPEQTGIERSLDSDEWPLDLTRGGPALDPSDRQTLEAAWERSELAKAEIAAEAPALNVAMLILMLGALATLVEDLTPSVRDMAVRTRTLRLLDEAIAKVQGPVELREDQPRAITDAMVATVSDLLPELPRLERGGVRRYERLLERVGFGAPADRSIPKNLDVALAEAIATRNVVVHRASEPMSSHLELRRRWV